MELDGKGNFVDLDEEKPIGAVKLDGADSTMFVPLGEVDPKDLKVGMKITVHWSDKTEGKISDMAYFKPE